jgi:hypothetical protein
VKRESEKMAKKMAESPESYPAVKNINLSACFSEDADGNNAKYETHCIDDHVKGLNKKASEETAESDGAETDSENDVESETSEEMDVESDEL